MKQSTRRVQISALLLGLLVTSAAARAEEALVLEGKIALPRVAGRIDHMAIDLAREHLLVAALGNGTLDVVDLPGAHRVRQLTELHEPQGIAYAEKPDLAVVASAGDGSVWFFRGDGFQPSGNVALGSDADNVRVDPGTGNVIVGYGSGRLAIIDPGTKSKIGGIKLKAHPEIVPARRGVGSDIRQRARCRPNCRRRSRFGTTGGELDGAGPPSEFSDGARRDGALG